MKPCPLTGGGHCWKLEYYEKYIAREECACGAVRFEPDVIGGDSKFRLELERRLKYLNKTYGREGSMVAQINVKELRPETREKLGITGIIPPVPSKPDTAGLGKFQARKALHDYYEANAPAITVDRAVLGDRETRKRWGFSGCGWDNFMKRHGQGGTQQPVPAGKLPPARAPAGKPPLNTTDRTVRFPQFSEILEPEVKMAWLNNYTRLYEIDHKEG